MYKFLGYMQSDRRLQPWAIEKLERMADVLIEKHPPQLDVEKYMITVGEYKYYGVSFQLQALFYSRDRSFEHGDDFNKMRFIFSRNGKKEMVLYLRRTQ